MQIKFRPIFITKANGHTASLQQVIDDFEKTDDLEAIKTIVENAPDRVYATWASVEMKDNAGELIPADEVVRNQETLIQRNGPISDEHSNKIVGETMAYKVLEHPESKSIGVLHLNKIHSDFEIDDTIWSEIVAGERKGSSVGGYNLSNDFGRDEVTGEFVKVLRDFRQLETASVHDPCNPLSLNVAYSLLAKSMGGSKKLKDTIKADVNKPFAGYKDFAECVSDNKDKKNPEAYCASIQSDIEKRNGEYGPHVHDEENPEGLHTHPEDQDKKEYNDKKKILPDPNDIDQDPKLKEEVFDERVKKDTEKKGESVINNTNGNNIIDAQKSVEDTQMNEDLKKSLDKIQEGITKNSEELKKNSDAIAELQKQKADDEPEAQVEPKVPEEKEVEETKKEETPAVEKDGEDVSNEVAGVKGKEIPESPEPEQPSDEGVFKKAEVDKIVKAEVDKRMADVEKKLEEVSKIATPRGYGGVDVAKAEDVAKRASSYAIDMAIRKTPQDLKQVLKTVQTMQKEVQGGTI